jgi:hypothetical protein
MNKVSDDKMRDEYDFSGGVRGKYADRFKKGTRLVLLDPDVSEAFPTAEEVNETLRSVLREKAKPSGSP